MGYRTFTTDILRDLVGKLVIFEIEINGIRTGY